MGLLIDQRELVGSVIQIDPEHDPKFGGCFMLVTEQKLWGVKGFVKIPGSGDAFYRCNYDDCDYVGEAQWIPKPSDDEK